MADEVKINADMTFEKAVEELNSIIRQLNEGKVTLDESLNLYKYGSALVKYCDDKLNEVTKQIEMVNTIDGTRE